MNVAQRWYIHFVVAWVVLIFYINITAAHSPHDIIQSLAVAPGHGQAQEIFVIVQKELRKAVDGGLSWKRLAKGLDNNHSLQSIEASPAYAMDQTLFVSTKGSGVYRSTDRGSSWTKVNNGLDQLRLGLLAISPHFAADQTVLAAGVSGGLYKSENSGAQWRQIYRNQVTISAIHFSPDPETNQIVMGDNRGKLYQTTDRGETWRLYAHVQDSGGITTIVSPPQTAPERVMLCGTEKRGVVKITADGATPVDASGGILDKYITSFALSPAYANDATIFATTWYDGVYRTADSGQTWQKLNRGLTADPQAHMMNVPHFTAVRPSSNFANDRTLFLAGFDGLFKSSGAASAWTSLEADALSRIEGIALSPEYHTDGTVAFSTYRRGAFLSTDGGGTWGLVNKGLANRLADIAFSTQYPSDHTVFAASTDLFYKSTAKGASWDRIELPSRDWKSIIEGAKRRLFKAESRATSIVRQVHALPPNAVNRQVDVAGVWDVHGLFDGVRRGWRGLGQKFTLLKYMVTKPWTVRARDIVVSPDFTADQTVYVSTANNRIFRSADGGRQWSVIWQGQKKQQIAAAISPGFATDRTLFVSSSADGVHKSVDGGNVWQAVYRAPKRGTRRLGIAISPDYSNDQSVWISNAEGLLKSIDGGSSWEAVDYPHRHEHSSIEAIAVSPTYAQDGIILISVRGRGLYQYNREQQAFTPAGTDLIDDHYILNEIVFSPSFALDHTLYAASEEALLRSTDSGKTWQLVETPAYPSPKAPSPTASASKP